ncbi:hypothetical protein KAS08_00205 [Candidatus Pacearchaeota archaeon]|nr:hypothetical protein [Candidatus Pacearchaeota archaeon]
MGKENSKPSFNRSHLDAFGYAQLGIENQNMQIEAMEEMYKTFLSSGEQLDSFIGTAINNAYLARNHLMTKQNYDTASEEDKKKVEDPGQVNEHLVQSLQSLHDAGISYTEKRKGMLNDLTSKNILSYHSREDGTPSIDISNNLKERMINTPGKIGEFGDSENEKLVMNALATFDEYKIHGTLNSYVMQAIAKKRLNSISGKLEAIAESD